MKQKILFIAPESFPVNGPEAIVNIKLLKVLSDDGFEIDLISRSHQKAYYPANESLSDLGIEIKSNKIITVSNTISLSVLFAHFYTFCKFGVVFRGAHWALQVLRECEKQIKHEKYDFIITKNAPSFLLGYYLKKKYKYKWIASWNDPYPGVKYPQPYGEGVNARLPWYSKKIIRIMDSSDFHIFPNERLRKYMAQYLNFNENQSAIVPHISNKLDNIRHVKNDKLKMIFSGNLKKPRNPISFILAFARLVKEFSDVTVDFVGVYDDGISEIIASSGLQDFVNLYPPLSYKESLAILPNYDVAMIMEADCEEGIFLPTKIGDFMQYEKIMFAISPEVGILNDLYAEGYVQYFSVNKVESIYSVLKNIYYDFKSNNLPRSKYNEDYHEQAVLNEYVEIFKKL